MFVPSKDLGPHVLCEVAPQCAFKLFDELLGVRDHEHLVRWVLPRSRPIISPPMTVFPSPVARIRSARQPLFSRSSTIRWGTRRPGRAAARSCAKRSGMASKSLSPASCPSHRSTGAAELLQLLGAADRLRGQVASWSRAPRGQPRNDGGRCRPRREPRRGPRFLAFHLSWITQSAAPRTRGHHGGSSDSGAVDDSDFVEPQMPHRPLGRGGEPPRAHPSAGPAASRKLASSVTGDRD